VQLAVGVGHAGRRIGPHAGGPHLVGAEQRPTAGPQRLRPDPLDEGVEVVAAPPDLPGGREVDDHGGPRRPLQLRDEVDGAVE